MIVEMTRNSFENKDAIVDLVMDRISGLQNRSIIIICAGHFMLVPDKVNGGIKPGVFAEPERLNDPASQAIGIFPQYTWKIGCEILSRLRAANQKGYLSLLVNDWQLVPPDPEQTMGQPNRYRDTFYQSFVKLPEIYQNELSQYNLKFPDDLFHVSPNEFYLKEVRLRDRFARRIKSLLPDQKVEIPLGMCSLSLDKFGNVIMCTEDDLQFSLTANSKAGCAGGICQMMIDISSHLEKGFDSIYFVNLMPNGCTQPVNVASELTINMLSASSSNLRIGITNIYFDGFYIFNEEEFYQSENRKVVSYSYSNVGL